MRRSRTPPPPASAIDEHGSTTDELRRSMSVARMRCVQHTAVTDRRYNGRIVAALYERREND